jgi:cell division protease FtsH
LVEQAYKRTLHLLSEKKNEVEKIALALLDREVLHQQDVEDLIGKRPYGEKKIFADDPVEVITEVEPKPEQENTSSEG